jgi:four helix bundle protein
VLKRSLIQDRSFEFAKLIINLYKDLIEQREYVLSKQLLRSGTSVGANVREASAGQSRRDFLHKMSIASKEARETIYWLELIQSTELVGIDVSKELLEAQEIDRILSAIVKTTSSSVTAS